MIRQTRPIPHRTMTIGDRAASWFNPRRELYARRLFQFIWEHGWKYYFSGSKLNAAEVITGLSRCDIDRAIDDLYTLGMVEVRMLGLGQVVELRFADFDAQLAKPAEVR